jgi:SAM-dependent methyltransferase
MHGFGVEIGYGSHHTILPFCEGYEMGSGNYDGLHLPVKDVTFDYLYSSHCLEHIDDYQSTLREWLRVIKKGHYLIIIVPHRDLYEKKLTLPSLFSHEHKRFYTPSSLLREIEESLPINSYRVRHLKDNDGGYCYGDPPEVHGKGQYEIELVLQKL